MGWETERIKQLEVQVAGLTKVNTELMRRCVYAESKVEAPVLKLVTVKKAG